MNCERCTSKTNTYFYSWYNEQRICQKCKTKEEQRSDYQDCRKAELKAIQSGNRNYNYKQPQDM